MGAFTPTQTAYRFYADDVSEAGSTALGTQSARYITAVTSNLDLGLRIRIQNAGSGAGLTTDDWQLQFSINGGSFTSLTTSTTECLAYDSAFLTDAGATTNRLGAGTGSFVAGEVSETGLVTDRQLTASNFTEMLYTVRFVAASLPQNTTVTFRVLLNGAVLSGGYTVTPELRVLKNAFGDIIGIFTNGAASITDPVDCVSSCVVAAGDLVVAAISEQTAITTVGVSDDLGNTYSAVSAGTDVGTYTQRVFYSPVTVAGPLTTVSFDTTASGANYSAIAFAVKGEFDAAPLDAAPATGTADITSPFDFPSTGTLTQADELVVAIASFGNMTVVNALLTNSTAPLLHVVNSADSPPAAGGVMQSAAAAQVVSATTAVVPQMVNASANPSAAFIAQTLSFKKATAVVFTWQDYIGGEFDIRGMHRIDMIGY